MGGDGTSIQKLGLSGGRQTLLRQCWDVWMVGMGAGTSKEMQLLPELLPEVEPFGSGGWEF